MLMLLRGNDLTGKIAEDKKKTQGSKTEDGKIDEEGLCVKALVELDNLDSLVEHRVNEEVAGSISVVEINGETNGTTSEGVSGNEGVSHGGLLLGLDRLDIVQGREVLEVEGEVHGVSEGGLKAVHYHLLVTFISKTHKELCNLSSRQL